MKRVLSLILTIALVATLSTCCFAEGLTKVVIGATPSPHAEVLEFIKEDMANLGYELEIQIFTEYPLPNPAVAAGQLDANYFQHVPYLRAYNESAAEEDQLVPAIGVHYEPYAMYSNKITDISEIALGSVIAVTNDPANEARALFLLQSAGLITLYEGATAEDPLTIRDISENPLHLQIIEMDADKLAATLDDQAVTAAVINGNFALDAGLSPAEDAVYVEPAEGDAASIFANYVVVNPEDAEADWLKALEQCLCSEKVADYMLENENYAGGVIPFFSVEE